MKWKNIQMENQLIKLRLKQKKVLQGYLFKDIFIDASFCGIKGHFAKKKEHITFNSRVHPDMNFFNLNCTRVQSLRDCYLLKSYHFMWIFTPV